MKRTYRLAVGAFIVFAGMLSFVSCSREFTQNSEEILFEVISGESFGSVSARLKEMGIITDVNRFKILAKLMHKDRELKVGVYSILPHEDTRSLIDKLTSGVSYSVKVTIPEGYNMFEIAAVLANKSICTKEEFLAECRNPELLARYDLPANASLEGYLFPDTYFIPPNYSARKVVEMMLKEFDKVVDEETKAKIAELGMSLNEILTLASIVEKESAIEYEKPWIAGVYRNRLKIRMMLQADPTLIYALTLAGLYDGNIRFRHFEYDSPYNTYKYYGLPPYPIANPGKTSIMAAIFPASVEYFYFCANPDNSGAHTFSVTLQEHNRAVEKLRQWQRSHR